MEEESRITQIPLEVNQIALPPTSPGGQKGLAEAATANELARPHTHSAGVAADAADAADDDDRQTAAASARGESPPNSADEGT